MGFIESVKNGTFVVLCEITPPKGSDVSNVVKTANLLKGRADALLVADMPSAVMRLGPVTMSYLLKETGVDVICNLSCRDRNVLALQSDALSAAALGIENIFISEGDDIQLGDHPKAQAVNELDCDTFLDVLAGLQRGTDFAGNELDTSPRFNVGMSMNAHVSGESLDAEIELMGKRLESGAAFFITTPIFNLKSFEPFVKKVKEHYSVPVIAELILLKSVATARYLNRHVENVTVPDEIIDRLYSAGDKVMESIAITTGLIRELKNLCDGVHLLALGWEAKVPDFLEAVGG